MGPCVSIRATDAKLSPEGSEPTIPNTSTGPRSSSNPMSENQIGRTLEREPVMGRVARVHSDAVGGAPPPRWSHRDRPPRARECSSAGAPARLRRAFSTAASRDRLNGRVLMGGHAVER